VAEIPSVFFSNSRAGGALDFFVVLKEGRRKKEKKF